MKKYLIFPVLFTVILIGMSGCSCKRNFEKDYSGPLLCPTDNFNMSSFAVTSVSGSNPANLSSATEAVLINAQFNETIGWTIRIKGANGAVKTYTGNSNQIALSWVGEPDSQPFFTAGPITVDLILNCKQDVYATSSLLAITTPTFLQLPGFMTDFDANKSTTNNPGINGNAGSASLGRVQPSNPAYNNVGPSPQGGSYFNIHSHETTVQWYYGGFEVNPSTAASLDPLPGLNSDPSTVYLNFYANSNGVANSQIQIAVLEHYKTADISNIKTRKTNVNLDWNGWKMVSIKLSDIGILDPRKISGLQFGLAAYLHRDILAEANMDMVIFTNDAPLLTQ